MCGGGANVARASENQWLIYIAPGLYKENFTLLPFISIKGYGKSVTILTPEENHINQINYKSYKSYNKYSNF